MSIIIDLVIVAFIVTCIMVGYIKGLTGSLIKILSFILSLIIAFVLFAPVSSFIINETQIDENIEKSVREMIVGKDLEKDDKQNMPTAITEYINKEVEKAANNAKEEIADNTANKVALTIVKAGTWIGLFIVARVALICLRFITALIAKLPVIKQFDKLGGILYGLIEGLIITYAVLAIISFITPMTNGDFTQNIKKSYVGGQMYNNNLLLNIIF